VSYPPPAGSDSSLYATNIDYTLNTAYVAAGEVAIFGYPNTSTPSVNISAVEDHAGTVMMGDGVGYGLFAGSGVTLGRPTGNFTYDTSMVPNAVRWPANTNVAMFARHLNTCNVAFLDGHVKAMRFNDLLNRNATTNRYTYFSAQSD
jgi:prepilin-type processing-associated H-X9-DG protein